MSNSFFQFKKFIIEQDQCAMKVSTDACLQGALAPIGALHEHVLDIGTGTGLLSLMLAQRIPKARIDAVELDKDAVEQAIQNVNASPFANRIQVFEGDINTWDSGRKSYDFIICNPPFFINSLKGPEAARNNARHNISLSQAHLVSILKRLLSPGGKACFLWPLQEYQYWQKLIVAAGIYLQQAIFIKDNERALVKRVVSTCGFIAPENLIEQTLVIKNSDGTYTDAFIKLLQPFYLNL